MQEEGVYCFDTYAPTPSASCIRLLSGVAVRNSAKLNYIDIQQAFVQVS